VNLLLSSGVIESENRYQSIQSMTTDQELIQCVQAGDAAFELLFERYRPVIRSFLLKLVHNEAAADDLLQETFLRVWTHAAQWDGRGPFKAWLYRIATNLAFNYLRSATRHPSLPLQDPDEASLDEEEGQVFPAWMIDTAAIQPDVILEQAERQGMLQALVNRLPEEKRLVFDLVARLEMSLRSAAERLGIPEGTVKSRWHYTRTQLAQDWQGLEDEEE
jgi:RNA polymerase sigma-70 factor (ECF subfamily)